MFSIYTPEGRAFSGPLERLRQVEKSAAAKGIRGIADKKSHITRQEERAGYSVPEQALHEYRSLLKQEETLEPLYHAYQIMSTKVETLNVNWSLAQAYGQFRSYPYQMFPVINDRQMLIGALSRQPFYEFLLAVDQDFNLDTATIYDHFIHPDSKVYSADPVTDVRRITSLLVEKNLDALPIIEERGVIVGLVSRSDILRCASGSPPLSLWC